jgi:hypothetical protein
MTGEFDVQWNGIGLPQRDPQGAVSHGMG